MECCVQTGAPMLLSTGPQMDDEDSECPVSFLELTQANACVLLPCRHIFSNGEDTRAFIKRRGCPVCRNPWVEPRGWLPCSIICSLPYNGFPTMAEENSQREQEILDCYHYRSMTVHYVDDLRAGYMKGVVAASKMSRPSAWKIANRLEAAALEPALTVDEFYEDAAADLLPADIRIYRADDDEGMVNEADRSMTDQLSQLLRQHFVAGLRLGYSQASPDCAKALAYAFSSMDDHDWENRRMGQPLYANRNIHYLLNRVDTVFDIGPPRPPAPRRQPAPPGQPPA